MKKEFYYKNAVVHIVIPNEFSDKTIHKAAEDFMRKVVEIKMKEKNQNGNKHTSGDI